MKIKTMIKGVILIIFVYLLSGLPLFAYFPDEVWSAEDDLKYITLHVDGMTCPLCVPTVKAALMKVSGVVKIKVSVWKSKAIVGYKEGDVEQMIKAVNGAGFQASLPDENGEN